MALGEVKYNTESVDLVKKHFIIKNLCKLKFSQSANET